MNMPLITCQITRRHLSVRLLFIPYTSGF